GCCNRRSGGRRRQDAGSPHCRRTESTDFPRRTRRYRSLRYRAGRSGRDNSPEPRRSCRRSTVARSWSWPAVPSDIELRVDRDAVLPAIALIVVHEPPDVGGFDEIGVLVIKLDRALHPAEQLDALGML